MLRRATATATAAFARASASSSAAAASSSATSARASPFASRGDGLCVQLMNQTPRAMQFSSSSSSSKPTIFDGVEGLLQYYTRCSERVGRFEKYEQSGVFPPTSFRMSNFFLFTKLQLPPATEIDATDFLNGAQFACDLAMHTMYSREFINFACGAISESKAASHLKRGLSTECYDAFVFAMNETSKSGNTFDLTKLDINGIYLVGVDWERLTLAEYKAEQLMATPSQAEPAETEATAAADEPEEIVPADHQIVVQRMRLDVLFETTEHLDVQSVDGQDQTIARDSSAVWRFESLVTMPDDVDWKIVSVV